MASLENAILVVERGCEHGSLAPPRIVVLGGGWCSQNRGSRLGTVDTDGAICWFDFAMDSGSLVVVTAAADVVILELELWTMVS